MGSNGIKWDQMGSNGIKWDQTFNFLNKDFLSSSPTTFPQMPNLAQFFSTVVRVVTTGTNEAPVGPVGPEGHDESWSHDESCGVLMCFVTPSYIHYIHYIQFFII
jgi:hypothetical protein